MFALSVFGLQSHAASGDQVMCNDLYAPVCASHQVECFTTPCYPVQQTYSNACTAEAAGATVVYQGECSDVTAPGRCDAYNDGCNTCSYTKDGTAICTMMACLKPGKPYCIHSKVSLSDRYKALIDTAFNGVVLKYTDDTARMNIMTRLQSILATKLDSLHQQQIVSTMTPDQAQKMQFTIDVLQYLQDDVSGYLRAHTVPGSVSSPMMPN